MRRIILLSLAMTVMVLLLSECKSTKSASTSKAATAEPYTPTEAIANAHGSKIADLNAGRAVFIAHCDKCHKLPVADKHDAAGWQVTLSRMAPKAKLTSLESDQILRYLAAAK
jgi:cytochrome c5